MKPGHDPWREVHGDEMSYICEQRIKVLSCAGYNVFLLINQKAVKDVTLQKGPATTVYKKIMKIPSRVFHV